MDLYEPADLVSFTVAYMNTVVVGMWLAMVLRYRSYLDKKGLLKSLFWIVLCTVGAIVNVNFAVRGVAQHATEKAEADVVGQCREVMP